MMDAGSAVKSAGSSPSSPAGLKKSASSGTLRKTGQSTLLSGSEKARIPKYLSTSALSKKKKLDASTGNHHGYQAEDYGQLSWPLPKGFGSEKYAYSLIDIEDNRYVKECAGMSKKLIRLSYDQQIIDLEWRKTYKALLDAEHRNATLPATGPEWRKTSLKKEVDGHMKYLLELQEQKDKYEEATRDVYTRCDSIKSTIKKETDLEDLRGFMEKRQKERVGGESVFWKTKFNICSSQGTKSGHGPLTFDH
jgi:hypothetical protein